MTRILVVDNYDSFVYTLNGYLLQLGAETEVVRNDSFSVVDAAARIAEYDAVLLSPGPGTPAAAGVSIPIVLAAL
ncbi:MAG TPA: anthranilate synthase component II, partial [Microbacteriaceae bacterium]|nr:anthranilate synthase component II [Microbacteriaceae bacterium]